MMSKSMQIAALFCASLMVASIALADELPADPSAHFGSFCDSSLAYLRSDLNAKGRTLIPESVQGYFDKLLQARDAIFNAYQNPGPYVNKIDDYMVQGQKYISKQLQENPLRPTQLYSQLDNTRESHQKMRDELIATRDELAKKFTTEKLEGHVVEGQKKLAQRLMDNPVQPVSLAKSMFSSISNGLHSLHSRTVGAVNDTCKSVAGYQQELRNRFEAAKQELMAKDERVASVEYESLRCPTTRYISNLNGVCSSVSNSEQPLIKSFFGRN